jgi:hypothetical protein
MCAAIKLLDYTSFRNFEVRAISLGHGFILLKNDMRWML